MASSKKRKAKLLTKEPTPSSINAIIALDEKGGIGLAGAMPWPAITEDFQRFKRLTLNQTIVMGRATWDSLPRKPLGSRVNVVVTNKVLKLKEIDLGKEPWANPVIPAKGSVEVLNDLLQQQFYYKNIWYIGGANLLYQAAPFIKQFWLTRLSGDFHCDTFVDLERLMGVGKKDFDLIYTEFAGTTGYDMVYEVWERKT